MPKRPRSSAAAGSFAVWTLLQHCKDPVLHWLDGLCGVGVAAARVAKAAVARAESLKNCMLTCVVGLNEVVRVKNTVEQQRLLYVFKDIFSTAKTFESAEYFLNGTKWAATSFPNIKVE